MTTYHIQHVGSGQSTFRGPDPSRRCWGERIILSGDVGIDIDLTCSDDIDLHISQDGQRTFFCNLEAVWS